MIFKETGIPFAEDIFTAIDLPHTLTFAIAYRARINSFSELPKDKRPPRDLWDKPSRLTEFMDSIWDTKQANQSKQYVDINLEEVE